ncbi:ArsS family sensor histidine kinase [Hydrogenimonas cancrithermarum]|uniref:histidine kinase n=1 Tax=Hydrogenimonas cancrithermarum TaxID=2993563 RepID=A0ABM8FN22_9BACT|nr:ArsS family sensor histidine kinase [Hydrogenimonas cancrithermarum]BDY13146.1 two-component sensor histidine kinase [Hydrogenimonas cancrithermarum]
MRRVSIFVFIAAIFAIAFLAAGTAFYFYGVNDKYRHSQMMVQRNILFAQNILLRLERGNMAEQIEETARKYGMKWVKDEKDGIRLLKGAKLLGRQPTPFGFIDMLQKEGHIYLLINAFGRLILFEDERYRPYDPKVVWVYFVLTAFVMLMIFWAIWFKLRPLKSLQQCIRKFGEGELDIHCKIEGSDEIAQVSQAIDEAIGRIRMLINSRNLFIRNIMHELKTPLTKGLLTVQMLPESKQKERLERIFMRLDSTISEFGTIEQLSSGKFPLKIRPVTMEDLVDQAIDLAMIEKERGSYDIAPVRIEADFKLLSIALKNLIDNAVKYSSDRSFHLAAGKEGIVVESSGNPLEYPLSYYIQPYTQGNEAISGLGLGLYIVDMIAKAHGFRFEYRYEGKKNRFIIKF